MAMPIRVLYVDDEPDLLEIGKLFLEGTGDFYVATIESAPAALKLLKTEIFDAIISDYQMPGMDGIQFLVEVRKNFGKIPFVLFTGRGREEIVIQAINSGADFYLQKGGEPGAQFAELSNKIRYAVSRNKAEDALIKSEDKYRRISEGLTDYLYTVHVQDGRAVSTTHGATCIAVTGYTPGEFEADPYLWINLVFEEDRNRVIQHFNRVLSGEQVSPIEHRIVRKDGEIRWVRDIPVLQLDAAGNLMSYDGVIKDITDAKAAQEQLKDREIRFYELFNTMRSSVAVYKAIDNGADFVFVDFNKAAEKTENIPMDEVIGRRVSEVFPRVREFGLLDVFSRVWRTGTTEKFPIAHYADNRVSGWRDNVVYRLPSGDIVAIYDDVTERKQAEEEITFKNLLLTTQQETSLDGILIVDEFGKILSFNRNFIELWNIPKDVVATGSDELVIQSVLEKFSNPDTFLARVRYLYANKAEMSEEEILLKDGRILDRYSAPMFGEGGKYYGRVWYFRDITERKRVERELEIKNEKFRHNFDELTRQEQALRENEARLLLALEVGNAGLWEWNHETNEVRFDDRFHALLGYTSGELPTSIREWLTYHNQEDVPVWMGKVEAYMRGDSPVYESEHRIRNKSGAWDWIFTRGRFADPLSPGATRRFIGFAMNITDRKKAEEALRESEEKYRSLFTSMINGFALLQMIYDEQGKPIDCRYVDVNPSHETLTGLKRDAIIGHTARESIPDLEDYWIENYGRVDKTGISEYFENHVEGLNRWFGVSVYRTSPGFVALTFENITERKQVEEDLRLHENELLMQNDELRKIQQSLEVSRDQYINLYDLAPVGYLTSSDKGLILKANLTAASLLAKERSTLLNSPVTRFIVPEDQDIHYLCRKRLEETNHPQSCELRMLRKGTSPFWAQIIMERVPANEGEKAVVSQMILDISERKEAQEALQKSEQEFHSLAEAMPQIVWITRADGWNIYFNQQWVDYTGLTFEESYGHGWNIPFHPDDRQRAWDAWQRATQHKDIYSLECRLRRADGVYRWWLIRGEPLLSASGEILKWFGTCTDIEEIKRVEEALREAIAYLNNLFDYANAPIIVWNPEYVITHFNHAFEDLTLMSEQEVIGQRLDIMFPKESRDSSLLQIKKTLEGERWKIVEIPILIKDGSVRTVLWNSANVFDPDGRIISTIAQGVDITDRKRAEEALLEANGYLNNLFDYANAPIIVWNPEYVITRFNHAFEDLTLMSEQEVIGQRLDILFPKESRDSSLLQIKKTLEGERWKIVEIPILIKDGSVRTVLWNSANVFDPDGRIISTIAQGVDITERKQAEEALIQANKKLTLLSSITRHDINNQMTALRGYTTLLQRKQPDSSFSEYFQKINAATERISAMIQFSREYDSIGVNAPAWQDCRTLVDTAAKQAPLGKILVKNDVPDGQEIFSDPLVAKVFYNLMDNAVRYGGKISTIRFSVEEAGDDQLIVCEDDGDGVVAEEKEKIFERGFGKNTGLGLALSREILSITGITIRETGEPGKGARFELTVPKGAYRLGAVQ